MKYYPKIETLYVRDKETFKVTDEIRLPEFENIKNWLVTEKIDGTNVRVLYIKPLDTDQFGVPIGEEKLDFCARTDKGELPPFLLEKLKEIFTVDMFREHFNESKQVCLYGEGYGAKIQKGGGNYREGVSFRLCDIWIDDWWLRWDDVVEIADKLKIKTVPCYGVTLMGLKNAVSYVGDYSLVAKEEKGIDIIAEGIVARSYPLMLFRNGNPVVWKLKKKDYVEGKK